MISYQISNILVPVDLSECALNAVETARALATATGAKLYLLLVEETLPQLYPVAYTQPPGNLVGTENVLQALAATMQHTHDIHPHIITQAGHVPETILTVATAVQADLIVMGTHGASGVREGFMGSNTYSIIKYASVPVLSVPAHRRMERFQKIIYPFRPVAGEQMLYDYVLPFTGFQTSIELLAVSQKLMDTGNRALHSFAEEVSEKFAHRQVSVKVAQGNSMRIGKDLVKYAQQTDADLIVANGALDISNNPYFVGPHTQTLVNCVKTPVLSIRNLALSAMGGPAGVSTGHKAIF